MERDRAASSGCSPHEGALLLKFWFHLSKKRAEEAPEGAARATRRPRWRVTESDWKHFEPLRRLPRRLRARAARDQHRRGAVDRRRRQRRSATAASRSGKLLLDALQRRGSTTAASADRPRPRAAADRAAASTGCTLLHDARPARARLERRTTTKELEKLQARARAAHALDRKLRKRSRGRRCSRASTPPARAARSAASPRRSTRATTTSSRSPRPTDEERAQPYLWRFWRHIPRHGPASRSSTAPGTAACWSSASRASAARPTGCAPTREINDFEEQLVRRRHGRREVLARRSARTSSCGASRSARRRASSASRSPHEDWRNRKKWDDYERAVCDMVDRTSTELAPWTLVEANDKSSRASRSCRPSATPSDPLCDPHRLRGGGGMRGPGRRDRWRRAMRLRGFRRSSRVR